MLKDFFKNVKKYFSYLMTVDFKELFINVIILFCIIILSTFVFIPIGLFENVLRELILLFGAVNTLFLAVYSWIFTVICFICSIYVFIWLFNKRFSDMEAFKSQVKSNKTDKNVSDLNDKESEKELSKQDELELPKSKDEK